MSRIGCVYDQFFPILFRQYENDSYLQFDSYTAAVDEFFSKIESARTEAKAQQQQRQALKKLQNVEEDHERRQRQMKEQSIENEKKAQLIIENVESVERCINILREALGRRLSWKQINEMVEDGQDNGDIDAQRILKLKLETNQFLMNLSPSFDEEDDEEEDDDDDNEEDNEIKSIEVIIDIDLNAYTNAEKYFKLKQQLKEKQERTAAAEKDALKNAARHAKETIKNVQIATEIRKARKIFWFEKFLWFISSDGYLVIGGRDQQQNEFVYKKHLKENDIYVHADLHGASSVIIKNPYKNREIPPKTLNEAGLMAIVYSAAWDQHLLIRSWWVYAHQVQKTAPSGEYLPTGSFVIRGKKNFLVPQKLIFGFGIVFCVDENYFPSINMYEEVTEKEIESDDEQSKQKKRIDEKKEKEEINETLENEEMEMDKTLEKERQSISEQEVLPADVVNEHNESSPLIHSTQTIPPNHQSNDSNIIINNTVPLTESNDKILKEKEFPNTILENLTKQIIYSDSGSDSSHHDETTNHKKNVIDNKANKQNQQQQSRRQKNKKPSKFDKDDAELINKYLSTKNFGSSNLGEEKSNKRKERKKKREERIRRTMMKGMKQTKKSGMHSVTTEQTSRLGQMHFIDEDEDDEDGEDKIDDHSTNEKVDEYLAQLPKMLIGHPDVKLSNDKEESIPLIFALSVCAPYSCLQSYKYKAKLLPGTTKKTKAMKQAIQQFVKDKSISNRHEREMIQMMKDDDLSRNVPGKVKLQIN
ncbi:hypothetical protein SNEBB_003073 [Seison nebaliae]|nr:hypothetical protein SNEBB_003073 [Seison nebaliae]